jgi:SAM-dependent methyltransferase
MSERRRDARPDSWLQALAQLGDLARVRLLRLVEQAEFGVGVGELATAAQLPQSTVSRHLKALQEHGWIVKRHEGTASYYRLRLELDADLLRLWETTRDRVADGAVFVDDAARLAEVLASRRTDSQAFFGRIGGEWHELRRDLFGTGFGDEALLGLLDPDWIVADLGCGTGDVAERLAPLVREVVAVDREPAMLDALRRRLADAAVVMLVLHHLTDPVAVLRETARILRPGGRVLVIDMVDHDRDAYRHDMGHVHLGFDEATVRGWCELAGFARCTWRRLRPDPQGKGPGLFAAGFSKSRS